MRPHYAAVVLLISLLGYWTFGLGAGDVKLLFLIALFLTPAELATSYWFYFSIIGFGLISLKWLANHSLKGNIALAPAICGAVLCISWISHI
jgi:Flp pilus assembly protein protease CpaA